MYWNEGAHARPHFHARYAGKAASIGLTGELISGSLPRRGLALVEWAALHQDQLLADWERARGDEPLEAIDPPP
jgi:hypothetical protein